MVSALMLIERGKTLLSDSNSIELIVDSFDRLVHVSATQHLTVRLAVVVVSSGLNGRRFAFHCDKCYGFKSHMGKPPKRLQKKH